MGVTNESTQRGVINSAKQVTLWCEGKLDLTFYNRVFKGLGISVKSTYGKRGMGAIAKHYGGAALLIRDRDFDMQPLGTERLLTIDKSYTTWRACIENYFLDGAFIHKWWESGFNNNGWKLGPSPGLEVLQTWVLNGARTLSDYQAVRWALASMKPEGGWPRINTSWTEKFPKDFTYTFCIKQAEAHVAAYAKSSNQIDVQQFRDYAIGFREKFSDDHFWTTEGHKNWFHGKDLMKVLEQSKVTRANSKQTTVPIGDFLEWAAKHANFEGFNDLVALKQHILELNQSILIKGQTD